MKLDALYRRAVAIGIANDLRNPEDIRFLIDEEKKKYEKLSENEREGYDADRLFNPYADSRILNGDPETEVKRALVGIDMEVPEILLAYTLNRERTTGIDLVLSHHPEGRALAQLHDVMRLQADLLASFGVPIGAAEQLMETRIGEVERRLLPVNHERAVDAARLLGLPLMCIHTPADNCVTRYLTEMFEEKAPRTLGDIVTILKKIPEYEASAKRNAPPKIVSGSESTKSGKIFVDMTGGTEGSKDIFEKCSAAGISTLVGMHMGEEALEKAKKARLNVVIAGHISSDNLGLNLLLDDVERAEGPLEILTVSGFRRISRITS